MQLSPDTFAIFNGAVAAATSFILTVLAIRRWVTDPLRRRLDELEKDIAFENKRRDERISENRTLLQEHRSAIEKLHQMEVKIGVFWSILEKEAANMLHRDDTPDIDVLLDCLLNDQKMDAEELGLLIHYMDTIKDNKSRASGERAAAIILKAALHARMVPDRV